MATDVLFIEKTEMLIQFFISSKKLREKSINYYD